MTTTIVVMSGKGGVGKTNVAAALALVLARNGHRVGILDGDTSAPDLAEIFQLPEKQIQLDGVAKKALPIDLGNGVSIFTIAMSFAKDVGTAWSEDQRMWYFEWCFSSVEWGNPDFLVVDLSPGFTPEAEYLRKQIKHEAVVVVSPASTSLLDSSKLLRQLRKSKVPVLGIIENFASYICACGRESSPFGKADVAAFAKKYDVPYLGKVPFVAVDDGRPLASLVNDPTIGKVCQDLSTRRQPLWARLLPG